jgi:hypothetical protein
MTKFDDININKIIELKTCIENKRDIDKLMENIDLLENFLIRYGYLLNKNDINELMREIKKTNVPNKYDTCLLFKN